MIAFTCEFNCNTSANSNALMTKVIYKQFITRISQSVSWYTLLNRMLVLSYIHAIFPRTVRSRVAKAELIHATKKKGKNWLISIRELNHIYIHPKVSIIDDTYIKIQFSINVHRRRVRHLVLTHQLRRAQWRAKFRNALWNDLTVRCFW